MQAVEHVALRGPVQVLQGSEAAQDGRKRDEEETKKELSDYGRLHCKIKPERQNQSQNRWKTHPFSEISMQRRQTYSPMRDLNVVPMMGLLRPRSGSL